jgi:hypothetical protein
MEFKSDFDFLLEKEKMQRLDKYLANLGLVSRRECNAVCKE